MDNNNEIITIEVRMNKSNTFKTTKENDKYSYYTVVDDVPNITTPDGVDIVRIKFIYKDKVVYEGKCRPNTMNSNKNGKHTVALFFNSNLKDIHLVSYVTNKYKVTWSGRDKNKKPQKPYTGKERGEIGHCKSVNGTAIANNYVKHILG